MVQRYYVYNRIVCQVREFFSKVGTIGGRAKSPAKTKAVRKNGKLGGRPKGSKNRKKAKR
jgi:hypothetical protein